MDILADLRLDPVRLTTPHFLREDIVNGYATQVAKNAKVCFLGFKCRDCENNEIEAEEVEYCIASGFVRIRQKNTPRTWITHIHNVSIQIEETR